VTVLAAEAAAAAGDLRLVLAAILGIAAVVLLITWLKVHPFLALILGSLLLGIIGGWPSPTPSPASRTASARRWAASVC
jgi:gluconate:H+ symporter, GntP family